MQHTLTVINGDEIHTLSVEDGANLRRILLDNNISPYVQLTSRLNCGGRGICATCGVWIDEGIPAPQHWHDRAAAAWGYPRLSCQIAIDSDMTVRIVPDKVVWGGRDPQRKYRPSNTPPHIVTEDPTD